MFKKALVVISSLVLSTAVHAGSWVGDLKVLEIYPSSSQNGILFKLDAMPNPDDCPSDGLYVLDKEEMFFDQMFALAMSAQARGSVINFHVNGCKGKDSLYPSIRLMIAK